MKTNPQEIMAQLENWDDYQIPKTLAKRNDFKNPNKLFLLIGSLAVAILMGILIGFLFLKGMLSIYIVLFLGVLIGILYNFVAQKSNILNFKYLMLVSIIIAVLTLFFSEYFIYQSIGTLDAEGIPISFIEFFKYRFDVGLEFDEQTMSSSNGTLFLIIGWVVFLILSFFMTYSMLSRSIALSTSNGVPEEVKEFTLYNIQKDKSDAQIRAALSEKGWTNPEDQNVALASAKMFLKWAKFAHKLTKR
jgi:hypothetical protein